jgi:hypothetical protein
MKKMLLILLPLCFLAVQAAHAGKIKHESRQIEPQGAKKLQVELDFGVGELKIAPEDMAEAATMDMRYNFRYVDYDIDYDVSKGTGYLTIKCKHDRDDDIDTEENRLDLLLSTRYPTTMTMEIGVTDAEIDLGGIPLEYLEIEVGAASGDIEFSQPNPRRLREINIDAGASSIDMRRLGNANFELLTFSGGVGSYDLDFRGEYRGESSIDIDIGLGSADIILPKEVPIRVETGGGNWFSSVDFHHDDLDEVDDGIYESPDFEDAETRIILSLDVGMGSVDLFWK